MSLTLTRSNYKYILHTVYGVYLVATAAQGDAGPGLPAAPRPVGGTRLAVDLSRT